MAEAHQETFIHLVMHVWEAKRRLEVTIYFDSMGSVCQETEG